jgi:CheY-like chemotaxis protein
VVPKRVLVVDDNVDAATTLQLLLKSLGHEACAVYDGQQALVTALSFRPDVVLLDIGMPGLDGYEVARRLRTLKRGDRCASLPSPAGGRKPTAPARAKPASTCTSSSRSTRAVLTSAIANHERRHAALTAPARAPCRTALLRTDMRMVPVKHRDVQSPEAKNTL